MIYIGDRALQARYIGDRAVTRVYQGDAIIWTPSKLHLTLTSNLTIKLCITQSKAHAVAVDWGDGSAAMTFASTNVYQEHTYPTAGDYTVRIFQRDGTWTPGGVGESEDDEGHDISIMASSAEKTSNSAVLTGITWGSGITPGIMRDNAFSACTGLQSITIPPEITQIGKSGSSGLVGTLAAFYGCIGLQTVLVPSTVQSIQGESFVDCTGLLTVEIGAARMGERAFQGCKSLTKAWLRRGLVTIADGTSPFWACSVPPTLYVEADEAPAGWSGNWSKYSESSCPVVYGQTTRPW